MKILILKPSSLGDVVHALPVLRLLRRHLPKSEIHWWIDSNLSPLLEADPDLTGVVRFERRRWTSPLRWPEMWRSIQWLRAQQFDWVIDLQCLARSAAFAWLANGKLTIGLDEPREGARGFYDLIIPRATGPVHAVDRYLAVLPALNVPVDWNFTWLPERPAEAEAVRTKWLAGPAPRIALQPGARWLNKRWPIEHFVELVRLLAAQSADTRFLIMGSSDDRPLGDLLAAVAPERSMNLAGKTSLPEMVECLRRCAMLVTNDSGPMHVAAALGKPVIALFGPTDPRRTGPYGQLARTLQHPLPCVPCLKSNCRNAQPLECLKMISPAMVFERVRQLLPS